jgi:branched-chain amino acid transport system permease protein
VSLYVENFLLTVGIYILLSWSFYLPFVGGQIYNGPIYSMAIGGYFAAYVSLHWGWPFPAAALGATILSGILAFMPGIGFARASGFAMAVSTLALIFIVQAVIRNLDFLGGSTGMFGIPKVKYLLAVTYGVIFILLVLIRRLMNSRIGKAMEAYYTSREGASALGINPISLSIFLQTVSGLVSGLAGAIYAFSLGIVFPEVFGFHLLLFVFTIVFLGGHYTMWGPLIFAPILWAIPQFTPSAIGEYSNIIYGAILVLVLILRPEGVITKEVIHSISEKSRRCFAPFFYIKNGR